MNMKDADKVVLVPKHHTSKVYMGVEIPCSKFCGNYPSRGVQQVTPDISLQPACTERVT